MVRQWRQPTPGRRDLGSSRQAHTIMRDRHLAQHAIHAAGLSHQHLDAVPSYFFTFCLS